MARARLMLVPRFNKATLAVSFNRTSPAAVVAMQANPLAFIEDLDQDQRDAISQSLAMSMQAGEGPVAAARRILGDIGLTPYQQDMVSTYRRLLETNSKQALDRGLRDRRYDAALQDAIASDLYLSPERIDLMVSRYSDQLLRLRAETIARTEFGRVAETTRNLETEQAITTSSIDRALTIKQWQATKDRRTRDSHISMDGQARLFDDAFDSPAGSKLMFPHDSNAPAEETINCRCTVTYQVFNTAQEVEEFLAEFGQGQYAG